MPPDLARSQNVTTGPNGLIERQVTKELLDLFNIDEQTLNTQGLQITTTIDPKAQQAAEDAVSKYLDGQMPDMRAAVVSIDPRTGGVKAYYGGSDAQGFDFAQAGLPTGSSFKVFALVAALEQGMGLGYQVDSSPVNLNGITITNVEGEGCGVCNIAEALKRSLNTSYYRLMLKLKNGPADVADAAHRAGVATSFPGVEHTLSEDGKGGPPNNGVVLGQYQTRVIDMASAYATLAASGIYHKPHFVEKVVNARGEVLFDASQQDNSGERRIEKAVADNVTAAMQPIAGGPTATTWRAGARRRPRPVPTSSVTPAPTGTPGWSGTPRRCRRRCGSEPRTALSRWSTSGADRCTARASRPTSGRPPWTAPSRAPTTSRSPSLPRWVATRVCPHRRLRRHLRHRRRRARR